MKKGYVHISFLLDRSGSMENIRDDVIGGMNHFFNAQKREPGECTTTLAQFDNEYEVIYDHVPIANVAPRTRANYAPRSSTALYDSISRLIDDTGIFLLGLPEHLRPERVLFVINTDGHENASCRVTQFALRKKIEHQRDAYKWEFVFLGANQDAILSARDIGIGAGSTMSYAANSVGTASAMESLGRHTRSFRATGANVNFTAAEKMAQFDVGALGDAANDPIFNADAQQQSASDAAT